MTTGVEGGLGPTGHWGDVDYSISGDDGLQFTPMTLDQVQDMYKHNLLVQQQLEEATLGVSSTVPPFGEGMFRFNRDEGSVEKYELFGGVFNPDLPGEAVAPVDDERRQWRRENLNYGERKVVGPDGAVTTLDKKYKPSESESDRLEFVPPDGDAQFGLEGADGRDVPGWLVEFFQPISDERTPRFEHLEEGHSEGAPPTP